MKYPEYEYISKPKIHLSNRGRYNECLSKKEGTWDIIAAHKTRCWIDLTSNINFTIDKKYVTCKRCLKLMEDK